MDRNPRVRSSSHIRFVVYKEEGVEEGFNPCLFPCLGYTERVDWVRPTAWLPLRHFSAQKNFTSTSRPHTRTFQMSIATSIPQSNRETPPLPDRFNSGEAACKDGQTDGDHPPPMAQAAWPGTTIAPFMVSRPATRGIARTTCRHDALHQTQRNIRRLFLHQSCSLRQESNLQPTALRCHASWSGVRLHAGQVHITMEVLPHCCVAMRLPALSSRERGCQSGQRPQD